MNASHKLDIEEKHFITHQVDIYPSRKSLKEDALPTLNLSLPYTNATNNRSKQRIEEREEHLFFQSQLLQPQPFNVYKSFNNK